MILNFDPEGKFNFDIILARRISAGLKPSMKWEKMKQDGTNPDGSKLFCNEVYTATLRVFDTGWPFTGGSWAVIGIFCPDGAPRHDWRDFQHIKNDLVGTDWEAVELYPDEQRLLDPSNYYMLWCAPRIPIGKFEGRRIMNETNCIAPQRPFA